MVLRRLLVVVAAAHAAATYVSPQFTGFSKVYTCAEAKEHDEIIFDCGGEFISKARAPTAQRPLRVRASFSTCSADGACTLSRPPPAPALAGIVRVVRHAERALRRGEQRRFPLDQGVPRDEERDCARGALPRADDVHVRTTTPAEDVWPPLGPAAGGLPGSGPLLSSRGMPPRRSGAAPRLPPAACRPRRRRRRRAPRHLFPVSQVVNDDLFGGDPCFGKQKRLAARLACGDHVAAELAAKAAKNKKKQLGYGARWPAGRKCCLPSPEEGAPSASLDRPKAQAAPYAARSAARASVDARRGFRGPPPPVAKLSVFFDPRARARLPDYARRALLGLLRARHRVPGALSLLHASPLISPRMASHAACEQPLAALSGLVVEASPGRAAAPFGYARVPGSSQPRAAPPPISADFPPRRSDGWA